MYIIVVLLLISLPISSARDFLHVSTSKGSLRGKNVLSYGNQTGFAYLNIPLAQAPTGKLRFQKPIPASSWKGVRDATRFGPACMSEPSRTFKPLGIGNVSEDCLQINVYSNEYCMTNGGCAVLAVVHGGQLLFEAATTISEERIINTFVGFDRNVVVVTMPYRLGIFGLINIAPDVDVTVTQNLLLWDLRLGLKWIQNEIVHFGGDSRRLTVLGHSSGAMLVGTLCVSPLTMHLFNQAIIMSGPIERASTISKDVNSLASQKIAKLLSCATNDTNFQSKKEAEAVIACLRSKTSEELFAAQLDLVNYEEELGAIVLDGSIMPTTIQELRKTSKPKSILIGTVTAEMRTSAKAQDESGLPIPDRLSFLCDLITYGHSYEKSSLAKEECMKYYGKPNATQFFSDDFQFYVETIDLINSVGNGQPSFMYSFSYDKAGPAFKKYNPSTPSPSHSEDYIYIFGVHRGIFTPKDYEIEKIYSGLLANYVNYGVPFWGDQKWKPWNPAEMNYFDINFDESFTMPGNKDGYHREAYEFMRKTLPSIGSSVYPLSVFPSNFDMLSEYWLADACGVKWTGSGGMKSVNIDIESCEDWMEFMDLLRVAESLHVRPRMFNLSKFSLGSPIFWIAFIVVFFIVLVFVRYRQRRNYTLVRSSYE